MKDRFLSVEIPIINADDMHKNFSHLHSDCIYMLFNNVYYKNLHVYNSDTSTYYHVGEMGFKTLQDIFNHYSKEG